MVRARRRVTVLLLFLSLCGLVARPRRTRADVKLLLKDGTYQIVRSYEKRGDRVRFYSTERSDWEEIPASLVDFDATQRAQEQDSRLRSKAIEQARELDKERFERQADTGFEIAPGFRLPREEGVFAFDGMRVIRVLQSSGEVVTDKKRRALALALPGPLLKNRALVVLPGAKAAVRISVVQPVFFIQAADDWGARAELVPVKSSKETRVVEKIQSGIGAGKSGELRPALPVEREQVAPGLFKLKPTQPLPVGEYAIAELVGEKLNLDVWDFGIDGAPRQAKPMPEPDHPTPLSEHAPGDIPQQPQGPRQPQTLPPEGPPLTDR
jgi:hypothetical protein